MEQTFISKIHIQKVRHLENLDISLSEEKRTHLILTGKNGSGKTSVLNEINEEVTFFRYATKLAKEFQDIGNKIKNGNQEGIELTDVMKRELAKMNKKLNQSRNVRLQNPPILSQLYLFFDAKHKANFLPPNGSSEIPKTTENGRLGNYFIQYMTNLRYARSIAFENNETENIERINKWLERFEQVLKELFEDENLKLDFYVDKNDRHILKSRIITKNREVFDFQTLSDGYSAIIDIVSELIMQMELQGNADLDMQGLVLIDEIETHLHISLQKKILPFLTNMFPNVQFIVTTHSPFVLNSIENVVIFDLENKIRVENLSAYSISGVVEGYFQNNEYSASASSKLQEYEVLVSKQTLTEGEKEQFYGLRRFLWKIPSELAPELVMRFQQLELQRLGNGNGKL